MRGMRGIYEREEKEIRASYLRSSRYLLLKSVSNKEAQCKCTCVRACVCACTCKCTSARA